ncbi:unnamed protein product [Lota lota]
MAATAAVGAKRLVIRVDGGTGLVAPPQRGSDADAVVMASRGPAPSSALAAAPPFPTGKEERGVERSCAPKEERTQRSLFSKMIGPELYPFSASGPIGELSFKQ